MITSVSFGKQDPVRIKMAAATSSKSIREQRPDLFNFTFQDRYDCERTVTMEVLSLRFFRTGTACTI
jgi:hypothetical protein